MGDVINRVRWALYKYKRRNTMGLFNALIDVVSMPVRMTVDVVKLPFDIADGKVLEQTIKGIKKIEEDLED